MTRKSGRKKGVPLSQSESAKRQRESYRARIEAGGLNRRQQITRLEFTRALLNDPTVTWRQAQKQLDKSQQVVLEQAARMSAAQKQKQAEFWQNDYKAATKAWNALAKKHPEKAAEIERAKAQAQLKMLFGKDILDYKQRLKINEFLALIVEDGEDFGTYWGY